MAWSLTVVGTMALTDFVSREMVAVILRPCLWRRAGFLVKGDAKALAKIHTNDNSDLWIATQNQDSLVTLALSNKATESKWVDLKPDDFAADIVYKGGTKRRVEFYYGSSYFSQSSRKFMIPRNAVSVQITGFKGTKRRLL